MGWASVQGSFGQAVSHDFVATTMLVTNSVIATGSQMILSHALGVIALATTLSEQKATTPQISFLDSGCHPRNQIPARVRTTEPIIRSNSAEKAEATRISTVSFPRYIPPQANSPHGIPATKPH